MTKLPKRIVFAATGIVCAWVLWLNLAAIEPSALAPLGPRPTVDAGPCSGADLSLVYVDTGVELGGISWLTYAFKNNRSSACTLSGFPRVELLNARGQVVYPHLVVNEEASPATVTIAPNQPAEFRVRFSSGFRGRKGPACPGSVSRLRIQAPGTTRWFERRDNIDLCDQVRVSEIYLPTTPQKL